MNQDGWLYKQLFQIALAIGVIPFIWISTKSLFRYKKKTPLWYLQLKELNEAKNSKKIKKNGIGAIAFGLFFIIISIFKFQESYWVLLGPLAVLLIFVGISVLNKKIRNYQLQNVEKVSRIRITVMLSFLSYLLIMFVLSLIFSN